MNGLIISDTHFTDTPRDEYRWKLFPWLHTAIQTYQVRDLFILGDLTESKDRHSGRLVNRLVDSLITVFRQTDVHKIHILRGNHDGLDPDSPFFRFLRNFPSIEFIETPFACEYSGREVLMLPYTINPLKAWEHVEMYLADYIFMHATVKGAMSESGQQLDGIPAGFLNTARKAKIYSGDVHTPQIVKIGRVEVEYVGAPYPVKFGDSFEPRAILLENFRTARSLVIPTIQRLTLTIAPKNCDMPLDTTHEGDQIKVRIQLSPSEYGDWAALKKHVVEQCTKAKVELCGLELEKAEQRIRLRTPTATTITKSPQQILTAFCETNKLSKAVIVEGVNILKDLS